MIAIQSAGSGDAGMNWREKLLVGKRRLYAVGMARLSPLISMKLNEFPERNRGSRGIEGQNLNHGDTA